jgi:hypothetical protein
LLTEFSTRAQQIERGGRVGNTPASYSGGQRSNLGPETGYPNSGCPWLSLVSPGECRDSALNCVTTASVHVLNNSVLAIMSFNTM